MRRAPATLLFVGTALSSCIVVLPASPPPAPAARAPVRSARAPLPVGPYSQAVRAGDTLWLSGQVGLDPTTGALVEGGVEAQTARAIDHLQAVLQAAGLDLVDVVEVQVFLADMGDFAAMNGIYATRFPSPAPARTTGGVAALPLGAAVEIRAVASFVR
jgi:2-iminobutanoate/2-iminopropanoate deaminase